VWWRKGGLSGRRTAPHLESFSRARDARAVSTAAAKVPPPCPRRPCASRPPSRPPPPPTPSAMSDTEIDMGAPVPADAGDSMDVDLPDRACAGARGSPALLLTLHAANDPAVKRKGRGFGGRGEAHDGVRGGTFESVAAQGTEERAARCEWSKRDCPQRRRLRCDASGQPRKLAKRHRMLQASLYWPRASADTARQRSRAGSFLSPACTRRPPRKR
jgi:hypothetical protein